MKTPYAQPALDAPDLTDVIDLLEAGDLVDQVKEIIDLTDDADDISEIPDDHTPEDAWEGGLEDQVDERDFDQPLVGGYIENTVYDEEDYVEECIRRDVRRGAFSGGDGIYDTQGRAYDERYPTRASGTSSTSTIGLEKVIDKRWGNTPVQSKIKLEKRVAATQVDDDIDDK